MPLLERRDVQVASRERIDETVRDPLGESRAVEPSPAGLLLGREVGDAHVSAPGIHGPVLPLAQAGQGGADPGQQALGVPVSRGISGLEQQVPAHHGFGKLADALEGLEDDLSEGQRKQHLAVHLEAEQVDVRAGPAAGGKQAQETAGVVAVVHLGLQELPLLPFPLDDPASASGDRELGALLVQKQVVQDSVPRLGAEPHPGPQALGEQGGRNGSPLAQGGQHHLPELFARFLVLGDLGEQGSRQQQEGGLKRAAYPHQFY
jgi:hypothetical protein